MTYIDSRPRCWAIAPARGGSKAVPLKNLHPLANRPLLSWGLAAAAAAGLERTLVSTEHHAIAAQARLDGAEVDPRPAELAADETNTEAVLLEMLKRRSRTETLPRLIALLQPTSPFVTPTTIRRCLDVLDAHPDANSAQSVVPVTHHNHAINQRVIEDGRVKFAFPELRAGRYGKQSKVPHFALGNFIAFRVDAFLAGGGIFGETSLVGDVVNRYEAADVDDLDDFHQAELYVAAGVVKWYGPNPGLNETGHDRN